MATVIGQRVPPLAPGDKLTREEFLRRWEAHPQINNAELLGGIVYMSSPVSVEHGDSDGRVGGWLQYYSAFTPGTASGHNTTSFVLDETPQPDLNLRILPEFGGTSWVEGKYLHGIPEMLSEISLSSASIDLHAKLDIYEAAKVPEYLVVLLFEQEIRWHVLVDGKYQLLGAASDGLWRSGVFPGLWLDGKALLAGNMAEALLKLQQGLRSPEHQTFVAELGRRKE
ncbi:MAG TPA: Uma2 family endonuclease [Pirellulales bacterium]|nr:Uma2 family endonuclease [Pirellulales bacterium]